MAKEAAREEDDLFDRVWEWQFRVVAVLFVGGTILYASLGFMPDLFFVILAAGFIGVFMARSRILMRFALTRGLAGVLSFTAFAGTIPWNVYRLVYPTRLDVSARWDTGNVFDRIMFVVQKVVDWPGQYILFLVIALAFIWFTVAYDMFGARVEKD